MRTAADFQEKHALSDGTVVALRHIRPGDAAELREGFLRLSPESRYRRFFGGVPVLSESALRYLTDVDGQDHVAIVAVTDSPDLKSERGLGIARFVRLADDPTVAEAAVTVVDDAQRKGLGRLLASTLADAARERGVRMFRADVLDANEPMLTILRQIGAVERGADAGVVSFDVPLELASPRHGGPLDGLLRAASSSMAVLLRRLALPPGHDGGT